MHSVNDLIWRAHHEGRKRDENKALRAAIAASGGYMYEIAGILGVHESTFHRWMRWEMTEGRMVAILEAAETLAKKYKRDPLDVLAAMKDAVAAEAAEVMPLPWEKK